MLDDPYSWDFEEMAQAFKNEARMAFTIKDRQATALFAEAKFTWWDIFALELRRRTELRLAV
jgi:hypothetical protein